MDASNSTEVGEFVFAGLTSNKLLARYLFLFFLPVYLATVFGNIGMIIVVSSSSHLQAPMFRFLGHLSLVDIIYSSVVTPKMLSDLVSRKKSISFTTCALQYFLFANFAGIEALLLSIMGYDRYVAICHPLRYVSIITQKKCNWLVTFAYTAGFFQSAFQTCCTFRLRFCGPNLVDHFFCELHALLKLSCSETLACDVLSIVMTILSGIGSLIPVVASYALIVSSILRMNSSNGQRKAFNTCSSHLACVAIFYGTALSIYLRPSSSTFEGKVSSVFYCVIIPLLNPLIYSLRNKEVRKVFIELLSKDKRALSLSSKSR
ncbi:olfactory receptor 5AN6-like [Pelodytes ibericus]